MGQAGWPDRLKMNMISTAETERSVWGPYPNYDDIGRFEYGRRLWRSPEFRMRLTSHWLDVRNPYRERFIEQRHLIEEVLSSDASCQALDFQLKEKGTSLRAVAREIPPVFGSFWNR